MRSLRLLAIALAFAPILGASACSSDDPAGGGQGGATSAAGSAGSATGGSSGAGGSAGAGGSSGAGGGSAGSGGTAATLNSYICDQPSIKRCQLYVTVSDKATENGKKDCSTTTGWSVVDHCPTEGLIGCCSTIIGAQCVYDQALADMVMQFCMGDGKTWSTTPP
jgi:hypothetical protein